MEAESHNISVIQTRFYEDKTKEEVDEILRKFAELAEIEVSAYQYEKLRKSAELIGIEMCNLNNIKRRRCFKIKKEVDEILRESEVLLDIEMCTYQYEKEIKDYRYKKLNDKQRKKNEKKKNNKEK